MRTLAVLLLSMPLVAQGAPEPTFADTSSSTFGSPIEGYSLLPVFWDSTWWDPAPLADTQLAGPVFEGSTMLFLAHAPEASDVVAARVMRCNPTCSFYTDALWPASNALIVPLADPLWTGGGPDDLMLELDLAGGGQATSNLLRVEPAPGPDEVEPPAVLHFVDAASMAVGAGNIRPGALVRLCPATGPCNATTAVSQAWAGRSTAVSLPLTAPLGAGDDFRVRQVVPGGTKATTTGTVAASTAGPAVPVVFGAPERGDYGLWVSNVVPGSEIRVRESRTGFLLGSAALGESAGYVQTFPLPRFVLVEAVRNSTLEVAPELDLPPSADSWTVAATQTTDVCAVPSDPAQPATHPFNMFEEFWWRRYEATGTPLPGAPVVFIMHGCANERIRVDDIGYQGQVGNDDPLGPCNSPAGPDFVTDPRYTDSYAGYDHLGDALSALGAHVFSIAVVDDCLETNGPTSDRVRYLRSAVPFVLNHPTTTAALGDLTGRPMVIVGHSMSGVAVTHLEAVLMGDGFDVRGVVTMVAEASNGDPVPTVNPALVLIGEEDGLRTDSSFVMASARQNTALLNGVDHGQFNEFWSNYSNEQDFSDAGAQAMQAAVVARWFLTEILPGLHILSNPSLEARLADYTAPRTERWYGVKYQRRSGSAVVLDDFDDADPTTNSLGLPRTVSGGGPGDFATETSDLPSLFDGVGPDADEYVTGQGLALRWTSNGLKYRSALGGLDATGHGALAVNIAVIGDDPSATTWSGNDAFVPTDLVVRLKDTAGEMARVRLGALGNLDYPYPTTASELTHFPETIAVPLSAFLGENPSLDLSALDEVAFITSLRSAGAVWIDEIRLEAF